MHTPTWKTTLYCAAVSSTTVLGLGYLFVWAINR